MKRMNMKSLLVVVVAALPALAGCEVQAGVGVGPEPIAATGSITVDFTIAGRTDAGACADNHVSAADVTVYDDFGDEVDDVEVDCEDLFANVELPEGNYSAEVTLVDARGDARSTTARVRDLEVIAGTDLEVGVDFPANSLY